jgi:hypothetical protein
VGPKLKVKHAIRKLEVFIEGAVDSCEIRAFPH